jgi:ABC-2 type transport system ATP-binding protein
MARAVDHAAFAARLIKPTAGSARVLGLDTANESLAIRRRVGFLPGDLAMYPRLTGQVVLDFLAAPRWR